MNTPVVIRTIVGNGVSVGNQLKEAITVMLWYLSELP